MNKSPLLWFLLFGVLSFNALADNLTLQSSAFNSNTLIPDDYTCSGTDSSPPLSWQEPPTNTQSLALVINDPDAPDGQWIHWIIFNIPPSVAKLEADSSLPEGVVKGTNSWGTVEYKGPCPPIGAVHRYVFTLYALDTVLTLEKGATKDQVLNAMTGHVIGSSELVGLYQKVPNKK